MKFLLLVLASTILVISGCRQSNWLYFKEPTRQMPVGAKCLSSGYDISTALDLQYVSVQVGFSSLIDSSGGTSIDTISIGSDIGTFLFQHIGRSQRNVTIRKIGVATYTIADPSKIDFKPGQVYIRSAIRIDTLDFISTESEANDIALKINELKKIGNAQLTKLDSFGHFHRIAGVELFVGCQLVEILGAPVGPELIGTRFEGPDNQIKVGSVASFAYKISFKRVDNDIQQFLIKNPNHLIWRPDDPTLDINKYYAVAEVSPFDCRFLNTGSAKFPKYIPMGKNVTHGVAAARPGIGERNQEDNTYIIDELSIAGPRNTDSLGFISLKFNSFSMFHGSDNEPDLSHGSGTVSISKKTWPIRIVGDEKKYSEWLRKSSW